MPVTREAKHLSGADIGKAVSLSIRDAQGVEVLLEGRLVAIAHRFESGRHMVDIGLEGNPWRIGLHSASTVTIAGKAV